ncbi:MAG: tripartite tricarboxylate transporter TctB family protein [Pseudothermotoga sp.]|nr:tripartite tricarboxylate transporter TctB family protein [Pseudothermotoga sp.]
MSKKIDLASGLIFLVVGLTFFLNTIGMKKPRLGLGSAGFPRLVTVCLILCAIVLIVKTLFAKRKDERTIKISRSFVLSLLGCVVLFTLYAYLLRKLGFLILTSLFLFFSMYLFGSRRYITNAVLSVVTSLVLYYVFTTVFRVPLPSFSP